MDWRDVLNRFAPVPAPAPSADIQPTAPPRVEPKPVEPPLDNTSADYWQRKATPAEIERMERYREEYERRCDAEERRQNGD